MSKEITISKQRDYSFDNFRGLLIWSIPISHFTRVGGAFLQDSLGGIVYITINVFVMQAFMFLSGYFSKNVERSRETAFKTFMLPYLVFTLIFFMFRYAYFENAILNFLKPPFALWFLFSVFIYRFYIKDLAKIKHLLIISIIVYVYAGQITCFNDDILTLGRLVSYFPWFLLGYYCTPENLKKCKSLKIWQTSLLGIVLLGISYILAYHVDVPIGFYLLKTTAAEIGIAWYIDILMRIIILPLSCAWIIFMLNIMPNKKNYLAYVGANTMPIYILHLFIRYFVQGTGFPNENAVVYYMCVFGLASLCVVIFSSPPVAKGYDKGMEWLYDKWLKLKSKSLI